ncbi:transcriptional regulator with XRE-family HTH domain [Acinetobacter lwoffii]|jgi:transcriptional regulator with XRE-family HTH domain|uniref:Transcriptional regulator with XRE-family HTH domain n=1 Tax=Acinetobacter lwoffii TaxID=28090 RepID=A0AAW8LHA5_ACILW|nr:helix-turn-helix domain-containing protein [Acinetobacter lwoffii]MDR6630452.1 transcriptional regulator with XRE-family HTH domain [Acinetobacter lwoffii]
MQAHDSKSLDEKQHLVIDEGSDSQPPSITYTKPGHGIKTTDRPLGAVRLEIALNEANMSQTELAREIHVEQATISRIINGKSKRSRYLPLIAKVLNKNVNWLAGIEPNDKNNAVINKNLLDINNQVFVIVPEYDNKHNSPSEDITESIKTGGATMIAKDLLSKNIDPDGLRFIYEKERAMSPDIKVGAAVTFNTKDTNITNGDVFVILYGKQETSRILFLQPNGDILIRAKEQDYPDFVVNPNEPNFKVLGRVLFVTNSY